MIGASAGTHVLGYLGAILLIVGGVVSIYMLVTDPTSFVRLYWARYVAAVDAEIRFQLWKTTGRDFARIQLAIILGLGVLGFLMDDFFYAFFMIPAAILPWVWLQSEHSKRILQLEILLDSWLLLLANALKAAPSLGEAISSSARLIRPPFSDEVDLVIKEMKLGTPLDQAVLNMSRRVDSRVISSSLATILVGRQTGGDLPEILEKSAATLREMQRLEGVVRTKTAEGKMQAVVLAAIPFILLFMIHQVDNQWLRPLVETTTGYIIIAIATTLWFVAIILARRILTVDV
jgi:tight adherence protein B